MTIWTKEDFDNGIMQSAIRKDTNGTYRIVDINEEEQLINIRPLWKPEATPAWVSISNYTIAPF